MREQLSHTSWEFDKESLYKWLARASLMFILAVILALFFFIILSGVSKRFKHFIVVHSGHMLAGMQNYIPNSRPSLKFNDVMSGVWEKQFENWFNTVVPFRARIIRTHNQIYYRYFHKSYMNYGGIIVGKHRYLYEWPYMDKYYNMSGKVYSQEEFDQWADDLQQLANFFNKRGQTFIYVVTPSKAAYFPEYLPVCRQCDKNQTRPDYYLAVSTLKKRGFKFIDGSKIVLDAKKDLGHYLFPKGGVHWTSLGAALVTREIVKEIPSRHSLRPFEFSYRPGLFPSPIDIDLQTLSNLSRAARDDYLVEVIVKPKPLLLKNKKPIKLAVVGSFTVQIKTLLAESKSLDQIDFFDYFILGHTRNTPKTPPSYYPFHPVLSFKADAPDAYNDLMKADIVISEENEQNMRSNHFKALLKKTIEFIH